MTKKVLVAGGGIAGLTAAYYLARAGHSVILAEKNARLGGYLYREDLLGFPVELGAESFALRGGAVLNLIEQLGLGDLVEQPNPDGARVYVNGKHRKLPAAAMLGIPSELLQLDLLKVLGVPGYLRALRDLIPEKYSARNYENLAELVAHRLGHKALERLITPVLGGVYSADPSELSPRIIAKDFDERFEQIGTLGGVVRRLRQQSQPGAKVATLRGGLSELVVALEAFLKQAGVRIALETEVTSINRQPGRGWLVYASNLAEQENTTYEIQADAIVAATDSLAPMLADTLGLPRPEAVPSVRTDVVTVVLSSAELDRQPVGTGVLNATPDVTAKALTHVTAKWPWLRESLPEGHHVIRLNYGAPGQSVAEMSDDELFGTAVADAAKLLGLSDTPRPLLPDFQNKLLAQRRTVWYQPVSAQLLGNEDRLLALASAVTPGNSAAVLTGAWVAGTGLAAVVARTQTEIQKLCATLEPPAIAQPCS